MKYIVTFAFVLGVFATGANATGLKRTIYNCAGGAGEFAASITVNLLETSPPGGPVNRWHTASASHSWLGGTHSTGEISVTPVIAQDGGPQNYINRAAKFALTIERQTVGSDGKVRKAFVRGTFVDPKTAMNFTISPRWLRCR